jgi:hypothetical protein
MPRLATLGSVLALLGLAVLACNKTERDGKVGSPSAAGAGSETKRPTTSDQTESSASGAAELTRSLVAVTTTAPTDAQPCERTCGRVGDCLLETREVGDFDAGRLELECLNLCVHSPDSDKSRSAFLSCEQKSSCGEVLGCARSQWDSLVAVHAGPLVGAITAGGDPCEEGCRWLVSCIYSGSPPYQGYISPAHEQHLRSCESQCQSITEEERQQYAYFAECLRSNCSYDKVEACMYRY